MQVYYVKRGDMMLGENIRNLRKENKMSQEQLAEKLDVSRQSISLWENGQTTPSMDNIIAIADIFGVSTDVLLKDSFEEISDNENVKEFKQRKKELFVALISIVVVIIVAVSAFVINHSFNKKLSAEEIFDLIAPCTVEINAEGDTFSSTGTGSFVDENGTIITNYHVIESCHTINVTIQDGNIHKVEKVLERSELNNRTTIKTKTAYIFLQIKLLIVQKRYEESYDLYTKYYDILKENLRESLALEMFLRKKIGLPMPNVQKEYSYKINQIIEYDEALAIEHINRHKYNSDSKECVFCEDFPIEELYYKLRNMLPIEEKKLFSNILNAYVIKYDKCGYCDGKIVNYIRVVTLLDSNDIITMFPIYSNNDVPFIDFTPEKEPEKPFVKRMNQIDKFNKKYGLI